MSVSVSVITFTSPSRMCCSGTDFQRNAKNIALFQMVSCAIFLLFSVLGLASTPSGSIESTKMYVIYTLCLFGSLLQFLFAAILFCGAENHNLLKLQAWLWYNAFTLLLAMVSFVLYLVGSGDVFFISLVLGSLLNWYFLYVVEKYINMILEENRLAKGIMMLGNSVQSVV